jgi:hypothetical protein
LCIEIDTYFGMDFSTLSPSVAMFVTLVGRTRPGATQPSGGRSRHSDFLLLPDGTYGQSIA